MNNGGQDNDVSQSGNQLGNESNIYPNTCLPEVSDEAVEALYKKPKMSVKKKIFIGTSMLSIVLALGLSVFFVNKSSDSTEGDKNTSEQQRQSQSPIVLPEDLGDQYDFFAEKGVKEFDSDSKSTIVAGVKDLFSGFDLKEEFWKDPVNILLGLGIAQQYTLDQSKRDIYRNEVYLLSKDYLNKLPDDIEDVNFMTEEDSELAVRVLNKYTDETLTKRVNQAIKSSDVVGEVEKNLGVVANIENIKVIAMDFSSTDARQKEFAKEHYMFGVSPKMWVEKLSNTIYIITTKTFAEDLVNDPNGRERHTIVHEFVHSQGNYVRGDLGRSLEEARAELFSGSKSAYYDAKQMIIYTTVFSGYDIYSQMEANPVSPGLFYINLYKDLGINMANNVVASWPSVYLGPDEKAVNEVNNKIGGYDQIIVKAIGVGQNDITAVDSRMKTRYEKLLSVFKTKDKVINDLTNNLGGSYGMKTAADKMKGYIIDQ